MLTIKLWYGRAVFALAARQSAGSGDLEELTDVHAGRGSSAGEGRIESARAIKVAGVAGFVVETQLHGDVAIVRPRGELDLATVEPLRAALNEIESAGHLVLDLRGLSFIDSTGLHLLVTLHQRAQRDGFQLSLVAPAAPADRAIRLCALDQALPFVAAADAIGEEPG